MLWHSSHRLDRLYASLYQSMHPLTDSRYNRVLKNVRIVKSDLDKAHKACICYFLSEVRVKYNYTKKKLYQIYKVYELQL